MPRTGYMAISASATTTRWFCPGYSPKDIIREIRNTH
jgi:hypothetical protein